MRVTRFGAILGALGGAVLFEAQTVLATEDKAVRAVSPWQDDPYDVFVSFAKIAVPVLAVVIAARLLVWRAPGAPDRAQQTARAAGALTGVIGVTLAAEWAAVAVRAYGDRWSGSTTGLIAGLAVQSALTAAIGAALWRRRSPAGAARGWRHDWLGDALLLAARVPLVRRRATPAAAAWVRRHATGVFAAAGLLAAAAVVTAQSVGEGWTDPLLIGWAVTVIATSLYSLGVVANAVAGFIARPALGRAAGVAEAALVAGTVALLLTTAFRDPLWSLVAGRSVGSVPVLVELTVGTAVAASALTAAVLAARPNGDTG